MSSEAYPNVAYSFTCNTEEGSEGRKEKPGTSWELKLEMLTKNISVTNKSLIPYVIPLRPTPLNGKNIQKQTKRTSLKRI